MIVKRYYNAVDFLERAQGYLERNEAANNLMLGICTRLKSKPVSADNEPLFFTVEDEGNLKAAAVMTPPNKLVLYGENEDRKTYDLLAEQLIEDKIPVPGVIGPSRISLAFAKLWSEKIGASFEKGMAMRVYRLDRVNHPKGIKGSFRIAGNEDINLIAEWTCGFERDAGLSADKSEARKKAEEKVSNGEIFIWCDGQPVSMAGTARPTSNGCVISYVYTPKKFRYRGYASACVAALSQHILDSGYKFCSLFTDLSNPTSNSIYMKMGYKPICDFDDYFFK